MEMRRGKEKISILKELSVAIFIKKIILFKE